VLPADKIRYAMGIGKPLQLLEGISHGVDCFDSIYPTCCARRNSIFTRDGVLYLKKGRWKNDMRPLEEGCDCYTCLNFSKAFVHHLERTSEKIAHQYKTIHNVRFMHKLMEDCRLAIKEKRFKEFKKEFEERWVANITKKERKKEKKLKQ
jgi:queuine tRNA-ribosyltransferase